MSQADVFQRLWREYEREHNHVASSTREVVDWAVARRALPLPKIDVKDILATQMSRALREEYAIDPHGRRYRVNHAVRVTKNGVQHTIWGILGHADHEHMETAFLQRREQIVRDLCRLQTDVEVYGVLAPDQPPIQLSLDFASDVAERLAVSQPSLDLQLAS